MEKFIWHGERHHLLSALLFKIDHIFPHHKDCRICFNPPYGHHLGHFQMLGASYRCVGMHCIEGKSKHIMLAVHDDLHSITFNSFLPPCVPRHGCKCLQAHNPVVSFQPGNSLGQLRSLPHNWIYDNAVRFANYIDDSRDGNLLLLTFLEFDLKRGATSIYTLLATWANLSASYKVQFYEHNLTHHFE